MRASLEAESGWRRAVVTGGAGPSGDLREPGIRVAPSLDTGLRRYDGVAWTPDQVRKDG